MSGPIWVDDDPDPSGVRRLLAAQPDPGPMPADVSARILAAIGEAQRRASLDPAAGSAELSAELGLRVDAAPEDDQADAGGIPGAAGSGLGSVSGRGRRVRPSASQGDAASTGAAGRRRRLADSDGPSVRRRRWVVLASAAATVAALGLVGGLLSQRGVLRPSSTTGSVAGAAARPEAGVATRQAAADASAAAPAADGVPHPIHLEASERRYSAATIVRLAQEMLDAADRRTRVTQSTSEGPGGTLSPATVAECVTTLGEGEADAVFADVATFEGLPAIVIVVVDAGLKEVYVVDRSCSKGSPGLVHGPVPMPS